MPAERFDIEIRDQVAKTIRTELKGIGTEARTTYDSVKRLNAELAAGARSAASAAQQAAAQTVQAANSTAAAQARAAAESARNATAAARLSTEQTRGALAAEKLALASARTAEAQSRANIAYLNEEAALSRAIAAEGRAATSKERLAAATDRASAATQREIRVTYGNVAPGSGRVIGSTVPRDAETAAWQAAQLRRTGAGAGGGLIVAAPSAKEIKETEQFARSVRALKDELDPATAAAAAFAAKHDLLNRGLEKGILTEAEHKTASAALRKAEEEAAVATIRHGGAVAGSSGKIREMIVVMRELARGDMTRLPGSLSILAGQFGLLSSVSVGVLAGVAGVAAGVGLLVVAMAQGEAESNKLANTLSLSGNAAAMTSTSFEDMAHRIADGTKTTIGSNKELLLSIAGNAAFTSDEMGKLVTASQELARATGQSADDVLGSFAKMADGPTQYAENFYKQYSGVITPTLVDHIRELEATGQTYEATKQLIDGIMAGLVRNQVEQTGTIIWAWRGVKNAVSEAWDALKGIGAASTTAQELAEASRGLANITAMGGNPAQAQARVDFLKRQVAGEQMIAEATARHTRELRMEEQGAQALEGTYGHLIDSQSRYANDVKKLQNTLRNTVGWGSVADPAVRFEEVLARASKSSRASARNMAANWSTALEKLKKQDMPDLYKAEHKKGRKGPKPWDREGKLEEDTTHLDEQIAALKDYGQALTEANMLESISRKYREHKAPLDAAELAALKDKIHTLEEGKRVQGAMTAAEEAANGPARTYHATIEGLNRLLKAGAINQKQYAYQFKLAAEAYNDGTEEGKRAQQAMTAAEEAATGSTKAYDASLEALDRLLKAGTIDQHEYARQIKLASEAYADAIDPLYKLNKELERNGELASHFGKDLNVRQYIQQLAQAAEARGESIYQRTKPANDNGSGINVVGMRPKLTTQAQTMVDEFKRQQQTREFTSAFEAIDPRRKQDPSSPNYILDHYKKMYAEIQRFRDEDVNNEAEAAERKKNLDRAYADARLGTMSNMLGQLASLQNSHSRTVAAIGKAAAIAQATIDGYRAVQAALAGPPGPPWSFAIAGVTAALTAVNVARIAGVGFQSGGYTGDGAANEEAGAVHRREYVFDAAATSRIGVPALEALRRGSFSRPPSNDNRGVNVIVRPQPGVYVEERRTPEGDIEMIARRVVRSDASRAVADDIRGSPNSHVSKAIGGSYGVRRVR